MKKTLLTLAASLCLGSVVADTIPVENFRYVGPFELRQPVQLDSTDVDAKKYDVKELGKTPLNLELVKEGQSWSGEELPTTQKAALHLLAFQVNVTDYFKGKIELKKAPKDYTLYLDNKEKGAGSVTLLPGSHTWVMKYLSQEEKKDSLQIVLVSDSSSLVQASELQVGDVVEQK